MFRSLWKVGGLDARKDDAGQDRVGISSTAVEKQAINICLTQAAKLGQNWVLKS